MNNGWKIAWCHSGATGGSKHAAYQMVRELSRRGYVVDEFVLREGKPNLDYLPLKPFVQSSSNVAWGKTPRDFRPHVLYTWSVLVQSLRKIREARRNASQLAALINQGEYDLVHIDQYPWCEAVQLLRYVRQPSILYSHEPSRVRYKPSINSNVPSGGGMFRRGYTRLCAAALRLSEYLRDQEDIGATRQAQAILTNSFYSKETFFHRYGRMATVCRYGVDVETFRSLSLPIEAMVLSVGRLVLAKQHHLVIEAVAMMEPSRRPRVVITTPEDSTRLKGTSYSARLMRLAQEKAVEIEIRMNPSHNELVKLYNQAIAVVFVPVMEPFGLVSLEAMACGTPVIGIQEAGIRESVIDGVTGVLVDRDIGQIAAAIEYLQQQENVRTRMSQRSVEYARTQWTWKRTIDRYEEEIRKVLGVGSKL